jgi:hypothetical protein
MSNVPQGWAKSTSDDNIYEARVNIKSKVDTGILRQGEMYQSTINYILKVNNSSGIIDLYYPSSSGDKLFHKYDPTTDKWTVPVDSSYDGTEFYNRALRESGSNDFEKLKTTAKSGAVKVINNTSSTEDKSSIADKDGYKSSIDNTSEPNKPDEKIGGDDRPTSPTKDELNAIKDVDFAEGNYRVTNYNRNLVYPKYLKLSKVNKNETISDVIEFTMLSYGNRRNRTNTFGFEDREFGSQPLGRVTIAIPAGITDTNSVNWSDENFNVLEQAFADISSAFIDQGSNSLESIINKSKAAAGNPQVQKALLTLAAQEASGAKGLLSRLNGAVFNPNIELLFTGPLLREFSYVIDMAPRDQAEARDIKQIIRFFKQGMSVKRSTDSLFLKAPHVFNIKYLYTQGDSPEIHPFINMIKGPCALTNLTVDYTPQGTYMTHKDGSMISYRLNMSFKELEPIFDDDYKKVPGGENDTHIGY